MRIIERGIFMKEQKTTLVIMAAGIGSRFGGGIKQLASIGPNGEIIMDYSIHDAIAAGFNKIVFIIRKEIENDFREVIGNRIENVCAKLGVETAYAFQELENLPEGFCVPEGRKKPWGTGQAVLACLGIVNEPFVVINADDYYGKEAFVRLRNYLIKNNGNNLCMAGFILKNTLSDNGGVTRGICEVDDVDYLTNIVETYNIEKTVYGAESHGDILNVDSYVSMNMWGLTPEFIKMLESGFVDFLRNIKGKETTAEFILPTFIGKLLSRGTVSVRVLPTSDRWFGVTYQEDKQQVIDAIRELIENGIYQKDLYSDLNKE